MPDYVGFDVRISGSRASGYTVSVVDSLGREDSAEFEFPFSDLEVENFVLKMAASGRNVRSTAMLTDERRVEAQEFGTALFDAVFDDDIRALLRSSRDAAERDGKGIRLRLRLENAPDLAQVPWEYMHGTRGDGFLALQTQTPIVRYMELPQAAEPLTVTPPISVLVMISNPSDVPGLDAEGEWVKLLEATADLRDAGMLVLDRIDDASLLELQRRLRTDEVHIFHYIGHGGFERSGDTGVLALEGDDGKAVLVPGRDLGNVLDNAPSVRLAVLNACEGARTSLKDPFSGVAQQLVERGLPAVVAMQFEITDDAARAFSEELYRTISEGLPIDEAVTHTRLSLFNTGNYAEWATPVLYMRSNDGRIFDLDSAGPDGDDVAGIAGAAAGAAVIGDGDNAGSSGAPPQVPAPQPLQATIEQSLARAGLPLSVAVDDVEVTVEGVVDDEDAVRSANDVIAASLAAVGVGRMITMNVSSLTQRLSSAIGGRVEDLVVAANSDTVEVRGFVDSDAAAVEVDDVVRAELEAAGVFRRVAGGPTSVEGAIGAGLERAGIDAAVLVTPTDVNVETAADPDAVRRTVETVLGTLGIGRMVHVKTGGVPPVPQPAEVTATDRPGPPPRPTPPPVAPSDSSLPSPVPDGRSRLPWIIAAVLGIVALMALVVGLGDGEGDPATTTSQPPVTSTDGPGTTSTPTTSTPTTSIPTTVTTVPRPDDEAIAAALDGLAVENLDVSVTGTADSTTVVIGGVVNTTDDRGKVGEDAEAALDAIGSDAEVDVSEIKALDTEIGDTLDGAALGTLSVRVDDDAVIVEGTSDAENWSEIQPTIDGVLKDLGVEREVIVAEVALPDVAGTIGGLLADAGYEGAVVVVTADLISVEFTVPPDGDLEAAIAEIAAIVAGAGYPQDVDLSIIGGGLPATGPADVGWVGLFLLLAGAALVRSAAAMERRAATRAC